ncbi:attachment protein [Pseudomonas aeruginosa]
MVKRIGAICRGLVGVTGLLAVLLFWSSAASAAPYVWNLVGYSVNKPSAAAACEAARVIADRSSDWHFIETHVASLNGRKGFCYIKYVERFRPENIKECSNCDDWALYRTGDSCANPDDQYNESTGACEPPPEECKEGELFPAKGPDSPVVTSGGRNYVGDGGAPTACYQSCEYGGNPSPASCYLVKGSTTTGFCNYILKGTGQSCGADSYTFSQTGDSLNPPDTPNTDPSDPNDPGCPPGWSWSGTTCVKTPTNPTDPTDPTTPGGDGGGDGGGNNNGGGNGGDGSGGGDGNGGGDGSGDGDGSGTGGDGNGTCDPAKENCSTGPEGPGGELKEPTPGTWDDAIATWEKKVEEAKQELKTKVKANVDQMKGAFDLNLAEGGGQLPCEPMTIWGKSYSLCIADYAGQLSSLRVALLLMAALIAALILLKD